MTNFPNGIGHDDHGIGPELIEWLQNHETIAASEPDASGITKVVLEIPAELRGAMCALQYHPFLPVWSYNGLMWFYLPL